MTKSEKAFHALTTMREILKQDAREVVWWDSLTPRNRKGLLRLAGINSGFSLMSWQDISPSIRHRIIDTAIAASNWAQQLLGRPFETIY